MTLIITDNDWGKLLICLVSKILRMTLTFSTKSTSLLQKMLRLTRMPSAHMYVHTPSLKTANLLMILTTHVRSQCTWWLQGCWNKCDPFKTTESGWHDIGQSHIRDIGSLLKSMKHQYLALWVTFSNSNTHARETISHLCTSSDPLVTTNLMKGWHKQCW